MATSKDRRNISLPKDLVERFEYLYPKLTGVFLKRALYLALNDKEYFEKVFFNSQFLEIK